MLARRLLALSAHIIITAVAVILLHKFFPTFACYYAKTANLILCSFVVIYTYCLTKRFFLAGKIQPNNKAVFITGCDSGFGNSLAKSLDSKGFRVFAGCLFPDGTGAVELKNNCSDKLRVLYLDVTKDESVEKAFNFLKQNLGTSELWALVNNAGIYKGFTIELSPVDVFKEVIEVNSIGPVRVTKAFLPLLRKSKGRIVNVNSLASRLAGPLFCAYSMSKFAALAFTECLSQEMNVWGVRVISVEPEIFRTGMSDTKRLSHYLDEEFTKISEEVLTSYGEEYLKRMKIFLTNNVTLSNPKIHLVIDDIESAIMNKHPEHVYRPRWNFITRMVWYFAEIIPYPFFECVILNSYSILGYPTPKGAIGNV